MQRGTGFYMGCVSAIALAFPGMALAQSAPSASAPQAGGQIQDILVTARRTSEALQTTPVDVTALNEEALETAQVQMVDDRSEEHTYELQSLMRQSYTDLCLNKKTKYK